MRPLEIYPVLNGWVVKAGCQMVAFIDKEALLKDFTEYLDNPDTVEKRYLAMERNRKLEPPPAGENISTPMDVSEPRLVNALRRWRLNGL